ncbi:hypothetical protein [Lacticaseibacillus saniviri]|uniref:hypothetical protein n=1 Tax=Lacticaseibacillus saniviri TaxID=931533 RepID=UPI0006D0C4D6|nr:hypothetical protein [Lacticaseibacillus saniviri]
MAKAVDRELGQDMNVFRGLEKLPSDIFDGLSDNQAKALKRAVKVANTPIPDNILEKINTELASIDTAKITDEGYMSTTRQTAVTKRSPARCFLTCLLIRKFTACQLNISRNIKKNLRFC